MSHVWRVVPGVCLASGVLFVAAGSLEGRQQPRSPRVANESIAGRDSLEGQQQPRASADDSGAALFRTYCASCHGTSGRGDGPVAAHLRKAPPDLTTYTERNGGVFPSERLRQIIDGTGVGAHGDREMPVWGDAFRTGSGGLTPEGAKARIDAIVRHLGAIQRRAAP
jgi:mono/diheme cytochrome c family protein